MRSLIRRHPYSEFDIVRRHLDQLLQDITHSSLDSAFVQPREVGIRWIPAVELQEIENNFVLRAEVPGVDAKDLDVQVSRNAVVIKGEYRSEQKTSIPGRDRSEFRYGRFHRVIPLRNPVQNDQVEADLKDGILTLTLPKANVAPAVVKLNLTPAPTATPEPTINEPTTDPTPVATSTPDPELTTDIWSEETAQ